MRTGEPSEDSARAWARPETETDQLLLAVALNEHSLGELTVILTRLVGLHQPRDSDPRWCRSCSLARYPCVTLAQTLTLVGMPTEWRVGGRTGGDGEWTHHHRLPIGDPIDHLLPPTRGRPQVYVFRGADPGAEWGYSDRTLDLPEWDEHHQRYLAVRFEHGAITHWESFRRRSDAEARARRGDGQ